HQFAGTISRGNVRTDFPKYLVAINVTGLFIATERVHSDTTGAYVKTASGLASRDEACAKEHAQLDECAWSRQMEKQKKEGNVSAPHKRGGGPSVVAGPVDHSFPLLADFRIGTQVLVIQTLIQPRGSIFARGFAPLIAESVAPVSADQCP